MWLLIPFIVVPIVEIALFIQIGGWIGLWPTLALVLLSAVVGSWLMRTQGRAALSDLQRAFREFRDPAAPLAHGALILLAGALMVTPGFFTDSVGLLLLVPQVRRRVIALLGRRMRATSAGFGFAHGPAHRPGRGSAGDRTIVDIEYAVLDDDPDDDTRRGPGRPSGWTRH